MAIFIAPFRRKIVIVFLIFAQKHSLWVHASTYNLRFIAKKMKILYPFKPQFVLYESGM